MRKKYYHIASFLSLKNKEKNKNRFLRSQSRVSNLNMNNWSKSLDLVRFSILSIKFLKCTKTINYHSVDG